MTTTHPDRTPQRYDAIVVGARVAGAATALQLARAGLTVLLVDRAAPGADTLSTHAFMRGGVLQLSRLGLLDDVIAAGTPAIRRTVIRYGDAEEVVAVRPQPHVPALYAPRRTVLDGLLQRAAVRAGVDLRLRTRVLGLRRGRDGEVVGIDAVDPIGPFAAEAPITVGADGTGSTVARHVGAVTYWRGRHTTAMVAAYYEGVEADGYQWLYGRGEAGGIIPTNDGQVCAWAATSGDRFASLRTLPDRGFAQILGAVAPDWFATVRDARRVSPLRGWAGQPGYLRQPWGRGWALVGDAGAFRDPLTTHGMTDALRDAALLAEAIVAGHLGSSTAEHALARYQDTRDRLATPLFEISDELAACDWQLEELRDRLVAVSAAMRPTVAHLTELAATEAVAS